MAALAADARVLGRRSLRVEWRREVPMGSEEGHEEPGPAWDLLQRSVHDLWRPFGVYNSRSRSLRPRGPIPHHRPIERGSTRCGFTHRSGRRSSNHQREAGYSS